MHTEKRDTKYPHYKYPSLHMCRLYVPRLPCSRTTIYAMHYSRCTQGTLHYRRNTGVSRGIAESVHILSYSRYREDRARSTRVAAYYITAYTVRIRT